MKSAKPFRRIRDVLFYENQPVFLAGRLAANAELPPNVGPPLDTLLKHGNNIYRHWLIPYWFYSKQNGANYVINVEGRSDYAPFSYDEGSHKWDLTVFNNSYFTGLRQIIEAARDRGIVVVLSLFDRVGLDYDETLPPERENRWPHNPWRTENNKQDVIAELPNDPNRSGLPEFFRVFGVGQQARLKALQQGYVEKVVAETKGYWNVFYEIMNEPPTGQSTVAERVKWADWVTGVIHQAAGGSARKQLIFYNEDSRPNTFGQDVNYWRANKATLTNYNLCEGVSFHGDPNTIDPDKTTLAYRAEKVFQVSSDGYRARMPNGTLYRDDRTWNRDTTTYAFSRDMSFTSFSLNDPAAQGVGEGAPQPSALLGAGLRYHWEKIAENPPSPVPDNFHLRFYADGTFNTFFSNPFTQLDRGVVVAFLSDRKVKLHNVNQNKTEIWDYWFTNNNTELHLKLGGFEQVFRRFPQPEPRKLDRFLYHWRKVAESPPSPVPDDFHLRFLADGSFSTFFVSPYRPIEQGEVRSLTGNRIELYSVQRSTVTTWSYSFLNGGTRLRLTRLSDGFRQDFQRHDRPNIYALVRFAFKWDKIRENPPNPHVPDRFRLQIYGDGSFTVFQSDPPYAELERGEVRAFSGNKLTLWSHTRSTQEVWTYTLRNRANELTLKNTQTNFEQTFRRAK